MAINNSFTTLGSLYQLPNRLILLTVLSKSTVASVYYTTKCSLLVINELTISKRKPRWTYNYIFCILHTDLQIEFTPSLNLNYYQTQQKFNLKFKYKFSRDLILFSTMKEY